MHIEESSNYVKKFNLIKCKKYAIFGSAGFFNSVYIRWTLNQIMIASSTF